MRKMYGYLLLLLLSSCSYSSEEYVAWVQDVQNGLHQQVRHEDFGIDVQYKPTAYMLITSPSSSIEDKEELSKMQYYNLKIKVTPSFCQQMEKNMPLREYLSYGMQKDICLKQEGDSLPCLLFHYERSLAMKCEASYILGFENPSEALETGQGKTRELRLSPAFFKEPFTITFTPIETPTVRLSK